MKQIMLSCLIILLANCPKPTDDKSKDNIKNLLILQTLSKSTASGPSYVSGNGSSGLTGQITISNNSAKTSDTLTINGTSVTISSVAAGSVSGYNTYSFTTPSFTDITENKDLDAILVSGGTTIKGTFGYSILPEITPNTPNTYSRTITVYSSSATSNTTAFHSYKFTAAGNTNIINISGYTGNSKLSINVYALSGTTTGTTSLASNSTSFTNASYLKTTSLTSGTTYLVSIVNLGTTSVTYSIGIANQAISNGASCTLHTASSKCVDYLVAGTAAQTDCTSGGGTYNASQTCTGLALGTIVGRCTLPSATNIGTINYYSNGGSVFSAGTASTNCSSISNSIFQ